MNLELEREFKELVSQPQEVEQICRTAVEGWRAIFNREIFLENLQKYKKLIAIAEPSEDERAELSAIFKYFKDVRKASQYLRTAYITFDVAHEEPENFHSFVWQLGQLKDTFKYPEKSIPHADILANILSAPVSWGENQLRPDAIEKILDYARQPLDRARTLIQEETLSAEDFHHLRKKLRVFSIIYTLAVKYGRLGKVKEMKELLVKINDDLGDINDEMVQRSVEGIQRYEEHSVTLEQQVRRNIQLVLMGQQEEQ